MTKLQVPHHKRCVGSLMPVLETRNLYCGMTYLKKYYKKGRSWRFKNTGLLRVLPTGFKWILAFERI